eukprot:786311-Prymnesium_polylepis.1
MVPSHLTLARHGPAASFRTSAHHASRSARQGLPRPARRAGPVHSVESSAPPPRPGGRDEVPEIRG